MNHYHLHQREQETAIRLQLSSVGAGQRLQPFSSEVAAGCQVHLIGPNGAGKSTLLARLAGLLPGQGEIRLAGYPLHDYSPAELALQRAYLCQQQSVQTIMPVYQYLLLHQPPGVSSVKVEAVIDALSQRLGLQHQFSQLLSTLSGGEWQRVRLMAILLQVWPSINPYGRLLLLDEPYNNLDIAYQMALTGLLDEFCQAGGTVILSSHDLNDSLQHAQQVWLLHRSEVVAQGECREIMVPAQLSPVFALDFQQHRLAGRAWLIATPHMTN